MELPSSISRIPIIHAREESIQTSSSSSTISSSGGMTFQASSNGDPALVTIFLE